MAKKKKRKSGGGGGGTRTRYVHADGGSGGWKILGTTGAVVGGAAAAGALSGLIESKGYDARTSGIAIAVLGGLAAWKLRGGLRIAAASAAANGAVRAYFYDPTQTNSPIIDYWKRVFGISYAPVGALPPAGSTSAENVRRTTAAAGT